VKRKLVIGIIFLLLGVIIPVSCIYFLYQKNSYPVEMYQEPLEIEYDFNKPGITVEEFLELNEKQAVIEYRENSKLVYSIEGVISKQKINSLEDALSVLYDYREFFGIRGYEYTGRIIEGDNQNNYILYQLHEGIRVEGYSFTIETTKEGDGIRIIGKYLDVSGIRTDSFLTYKECWEKNTSLARYDLNESLYEFTVVVAMDRFKGLDLVNSVPEEL